MPPPTLNSEEPLDRLKADHGGALGGGHRHVLGRGREPDDEGPVVGEHWLVPRDAQLHLRVGEPEPHQHVRHPRAIVVVRDGREELVEGLESHGVTIAGGITARSRASGRGLINVSTRPAHCPITYSPVTFLRKVTGATLPLVSLPPVALLLFQGPPPTCMRLRGCCARPGCGGGLDRGRGCGR